MLIPSYTFDSVTITPNTIIVDERIAAAVDALMDIHIKAGRPRRVESSIHWQMLEYIMELWQGLYPQHAKDFLSSMEKFRRASNRLGIGKEKGGALVQHQLEMPQKLYQMITFVFPDQELDKKFVQKFTDRFKAFKPYYD